MRPATQALTIPTPSINKTYNQWYRKMGLTEQNLRCNIVEETQVQSNRRPRCIMDGLSILIDTPHTGTTNAMCSYPAEISFLWATYMYIDIVMWGMTHRTSVVIFRKRNKHNGPCTIVVLGMLNLQFEPRRFLQIHLNNQYRRRWVICVPCVGCTPVHFTTIKRHM